MKTCMCTGETGFKTKQNKTKNLITVLNYQILHRISSKLPDINHFKEKQNRFD